MRHSEGAQRARVPMTEQQQNCWMPLSLLRGEWKPAILALGWHHQPAEVTRQQLAKSFFKD